ncbi:hypothetical protein NP234_24960, partial [Salmonella enterica]|nr:hypothetical protein [Salmonella enterica]
MLRPKPHEKEFHATIKLVAEDDGTEDAAGEPRINLDDEVGVDEETMKDAEATAAHAEKENIFHSPASEEQSVPEASKSVPEASKQRLDQVEADLAELKRDVKGLHS